MCNRSIRTRMPRPLQVALAATLAASGAQAAQLADLPLEELMRVEVVSAARKTQRLADVPASMHVVTAEDIRSSGARNLPEALRLVPGMDVAQLSGSRWGVSTRGFTGRYANKLLVLVDGRSVYSPMFSGVLWEAERVPLDNIERIEVLHGPAGSIWGSNAVNGVINIITRAAADTQGNLADVAVGDGGRRTLRARHGGSAGEGAAWRLGALSDAGEAGHGTVVDDANDAFRTRMADARWDRSWSADARSTVEAQVLRSRSDELLIEGLYVPPYAQLLPIGLEVDRLTLAARHEQKLSADLSLNVGAGYTRERIRFGQRVDVRPVTLGAEGSAVWRMAETHELTFGGGLRHVDLPGVPTDWIRFNPAERRGLEWSLFAQDEWTLSPGRWRAVAGVRIDHDLYTGSHVQPNLRLLFTPTDDVALWAALSRANRTPARGEQDGIIKVAVVPPGTPQNPGPLPLQLLSGSGQSDSGLHHRYTDAAEAGLRVQTGAGWSFDLSLFAHQVRDDIGAGVPAGAPVLVPAPQPYLELRNAAQPYTIHLRGFEAAAEWRPTPGWRQQFAVSHLDVSVPADAAASGLDRQLYATPRWLAHWRSVVDLAPALRLDTRVRHAGRRGSPSNPSQHVEAYTALDATLTWRAGAQTELQLGGTNLLRPATVEFSPDFGLASATVIPRRAFVRWRQTF